MHSVTITQSVPMALVTSKRVYVHLVPLDPNVEQEWNTVIRPSHAEKEMVFFEHGTDLRSLCNKLDLSTGNAADWSLFRQLRNNPVVTRRSFGGARYLCEGVAIGKEWLRRFCVKENIAELIRLPKDDQRPEDQDWTVWHPVYVPTMEEHWSALRVMQQAVCMTRYRGEMCAFGFLEDGRFAAADSVDNLYILHEDEPEDEKRGDQAKLDVRELKVYRMLEQAAANHKLRQGLKDRGVWLYATLIGPDIEENPHGVEQLELRAHAMWDTVRRVFVDHEWMVLVCQQRLYVPVAQVHWKREVPSNVSRAKFCSEASKLRYVLIDGKPEPCGVLVRAVDERDVAFTFCPH